MQQVDPGFHLAQQGIHNSIHEYNIFIYASVSQWYIFLAVALILANRALHIGAHSTCASELCSTAYAAGWYTMIAHGKISMITIENIGKNKKRIAQVL